MTHPPTSNYVVRRLNWKWPDWRGALAERSFYWKLPEKQFFEKWSCELQRIEASEVLQRELIDDVNAEHGRQKQRESYKKFAPVRRADAKKTRERIKCDPLKKAAQNQKVLARMTKRLETDLDFRLRKKLRTRIHMALRGYKKADGTVQFLGCSLQEARAYLEAQFQDGMTWDNWGRNRWHIDHIVPCREFDLTDPEQQRKCFNYTNLRPMWETENCGRDNVVRKR